MDETATDMLPVKLLRNYRPYDKYRVVVEGDDGDEMTDKVSVEGTKEWAGTRLMLPPDEARRAVKLGIAERDDKF